MPNNDSFDDVMARLREGDEEAATKVFHRFASELIALARSRLDRLLSSKVDAEDVLQSAFRTFFKGTSKGQFEVHNWDSLWGLLTTITLRKCGRQIEYFRAARRDHRREATHTGAADDSLGPPDMACPAPTPEEAAVLAETLDGLLRRLDERSRTIVSLRLQGYTTPEIGKLADCTERTVQRVLEQVRKWLERRQEASETQ